MAALALPGAASAAPGPQCSGSNITAQGSSLQKDAQINVWTKQFNLSEKSKVACAGGSKQGTGGKPTVTYTSTGSGAGLESWGVGGATPNYAANAFVGTDEPPNATQISEIEAHETTLIPQTVESIPVVQESVAVIIHLPAGCVAETKYKKEKRLVLNNVTLEKIYRGTIKNWSEVTDDGDKITGCTPGAIQPVARFDQSGTTHIFKRYLHLIDPSNFTDEKSNSTDWNTVSEGSLNTDWPQAANVVKPAAKGGGEMLAKVLSTPGAIGYVNIAEARLNANFVPPAGGAGTNNFWAPVQNNGLETSGKLKYADPSSNGESATLDEANCKNIEYTNGVEPFPPASVQEPWNEVTTRTIQKKYPLCGLTYDLAFTSFGAYTGTTLGEATTVHDYLTFVTDAKGGGGQKVIAKHDYLALPKGKVLEEAQKGAAKIASGSPF
ncbi:MAG TPA: extracellular solute-binding protein [Solirubrobacteraceae bacterium]|nr:extracellular solute-binding protein [Solirubrobacteraceae bacterium]